jgi:DNA-binding response OmpR family regulator
MPKVMLIEDDANMFSIVKMFLEFEGYEVVHWENGEQIDDILNRLQSERPDLVLLDVNLRYLNGFDILHQLRADPALADVQVLMASGMDMTYKSQREGANGFILKPFMPDELVEKIKQLIG